MGVGLGGCNSFVYVCGYEHFYLCVAGKGKIINLSSKFIIDCLEFRNQQNF
jgi:hypothetical protein